MIANGENSIADHESLKQSCVASFCNDLCLFQKTPDIHREGNPPMSPSVICQFVSHSEWIVRLKMSP